MKLILETYVTGYKTHPRVKLNVYRNDLKHKALPIVIQIDRRGWDHGLYSEDNIAGLRLTQDNIDALIKTLVNVRVELENGNS